LISGAEPAVKFPQTVRKRRNSLYFSLLAGNLSEETGSQVTASSGKLIVKGILHPDDAKRAAMLGADAVVVSNHGGRNLDGSMAPLDALPEIADVIGSRAEVFMDGGIRRGADIAKAVALGAKCVLIGRPTLYGTAVAGEIGATHVLDNLKKEFLYTLATLGVPKVSELSRDIIYAPHLARRTPKDMKIAAE
jgi:isopentenyl diphosphate isomerase/L-lactate dehydrogenase-like FMN-dependent dehydrogenase